MQDVKRIIQIVASISDLPAFYFETDRMENIYGGFFSEGFFLNNLMPFLFRQTKVFFNKETAAKLPVINRYVNFAGFSFIVVIFNDNPLSSAVFGPVFVETYDKEQTVAQLCGETDSPFTQDSAMALISRIPVKDSVFMQSFAKSFLILCNSEYPSNVKINTAFEEKSQKKVVATIPENRINEDEINQRYMFERELKTLIRQGNSEKLRKLLIPKDSLAVKNMVYRTVLKQRSSGVPNLRQEKNLITVMNTIFRQGADEAGLPPIFIHSISEEIATKTNRAGSSEELMEVIGKMIDSYCNSIINVSLQNHSRSIVKVQKYILSNIDSEIRLDDLAALTKLDKSYLCRLFKHECKMTINEYITNQRISEAKWMLESTDKSIAEIAGLLGYSSQSYFCSVFKKATSVTPVKYRKGLN